MTRRALVAVPWIAAVVLLAVIAPGIAIAIAAFVALIILPGWALSSLLVPRDDEPASAVVATIGLGMSLAIGVGVALGVTPVGTGAVPLVLIAAAVLSVVAVASRRRAFSRQGQTRFDGRQVATIGLAVLLSVGAFGISRASLALRDDSGSTYLWMVPEDDGSVRVGIDHNGQAAAEYRLVMEVADSTVREWQGIHLEPGQQWEDRLPSRPAGEVRGRLFEAGSAEEPIREVVLADPAASE